MDHTKSYYMSARYVDSYGYDAPPPGGESNNNLPCGCQILIAIIIIILLGLFSMYMENRPPTLPPDWAW